MKSEGPAAREREEDAGAGPVTREELLLFLYRMSGSLTFADRLAGALTEAGGGPSPSLRRAADSCIEALTLGSAPGAAPALQPFPDELLPDSALTGSLYEPRESVSLEFVAALQALEPKARAALLLREALGPGEEHAGGAELEAALRAFAGRYDASLGRREPPGGEDAMSLGMTYIFNWEAGDPGGLGDMLAGDAVLKALPEGVRAEGGSEVLAWLAGGPLAGGAAGRWRLLPTRANGQMAFAAYELEVRRQVYVAHSMQVVWFSGRKVGELWLFAYPPVFELFRLPDEFTAQGRNAH